MGDHGMCFLFCLTRHDVTMITINTQERTYETRTQRCRAESYERTHTHAHTSARVRSATQRQRTNAITDARDAQTRTCTRERDAHGTSTKAGRGLHTEPGLTPWDDPGTPRGVTGSSPGVPSHRLTANMEPADHEARVLAI